LTSPVTLDPAIHTRVPTSTAAANLQSIDQLKTLFAQLPKIILQEVVAVIKAETGIDLSGFLPLIEGLSGSLSFPLNSLESIFKGIDLTNPGSILAAIGGAVGGLLQPFLALLGGGATSTGSDPTAVLLGSVLNQFAQLPGSLLQQLFGQNATTQAQVNALQSGGFSHDFGSNGVTGWTSLPGYTLALSPRGGFIQAVNETVAYRASGLTTDKYGAHAALNPNMRGTSVLGICCTSTASNWIGLEVDRGFDGDSLRLVTGASPTLSVVQAEADFTGANRLSALTAVDLRTDGVNTFYVLYNNQPVPALTWTDGGSLIAHGSSNRNVLLTSNGLDRNEDGYYGPAITKVVSYGW
jgi:hypothetical protein